MPWLAIMNLGPIIELKIPYYVNDKFSVETFRKILNLAKIIRGDYERITAGQ
jgi:hypothetical protein